MLVRRHWTRPSSRSAARSRAGARCGARRAPRPAASRRAACRARARSGSSPCPRAPRSLRRLHACATLGRVDERPALDVARPQLRRSDLREDLAAGSTRRPTRRWRGPGGRTAAGCRPSRRSQDGPRVAHVAVREVRPLGQAEVRHLSSTSARRARAPRRWRRCRSRPSARRAACRRGAPGSRARRPVEITTSGRSRSEHPADLDRAAQQRELVPAAGVRYRVEAGAADLVAMPGGGRQVGHVVAFERRARAGGAGPSGRRWTRRRGCVAERRCIWHGKTSASGGAASASGRWGGSAFPRPARRPATGERRDHRARR